MPVKVWPMTFLSSRRALPVTAGLFAAFTLAVILLRPPLPIDETRYLTVAWEMWRDGTRMVPHLNGELYGHKPPLLFWLMNLVWAVAGVTEIGARLVAPAFSLAVLALTWALARRLWPEDRARAGLATVILATTGAYLVYGSATMFDTMLAAAVLLALLALLALRRGGGTRAVLALGAAIALGVYAKGPVVLVHVLPVALLMPLWAEAGTRPPFARWLRDIGLAVLVAVALAGLWLGPALVLGGPEYRADLLWRQSAGRMVAAFAHDRPVWFFLALLPVYLWPWGWTREGLGALAPRRLWVEEPARLVAVWAGSALLAFSLISGKQPHYLVPELPALALLLSGGGLPREGALPARLLPLLPAALVLLFVLAVALGRAPRIAVNGSHVTAAGMAVAAILLLTLLAGTLRLRQRWPALVLAAPLTLLVLLAPLSPVLFAGYDAAPIARQLAADEARGIAMTDKVYHGQFGFAGRLAGPVAHPDGPEALAAWAAEHPRGLVVSREKVTSMPLELIGQRSFDSHDYSLYRVPETRP